MHPTLTNQLATDRQESLRRSAAEARAGAAHPVARDHPTPAPGSPGSMRQALGHLLIRTGHRLATP